MPFLEESLFRHIKGDISGMTVPWLYVGMMLLDLLLAQRGPLCVLRPTTNILARPRPGTVFQVEDAE